MLHSLAVNRKLEVDDGCAHRLGASFDGEGTNFALFSAHAERVELCLFDATGGVEIARIELPQKTGDVWHGYLPTIEPGTVYGFRVHGPYEPGEGFRFNAYKLLLDPYARELVGEFSWDESHFAFPCKEDAQDLGFDKRDNAAFMPKAVVTAPATMPYVDFHQRVPWHETVIYECHPRGFTMCDSNVPADERGTLAGLSRRLDYIKALGVTSIELMPVHSFIDELFLVERGLTNYWGYNTLNYFCPHGPYVGSAGAAAFRALVDCAHDTGLEVLLDVVYNHTAEGNHLGPTLSFRGIDNTSYYQLLPGDRRFYINDTGCGNTLNIRHPRVMQMVLDSLRYWAGEIGVDGFRFDLATQLGRGEGGFDRDAPFFQAIAQDPVLAGRKLIAEPWDIGPDGYQLGNYPAGFSEWNDRYRDTVRRYWRGDAGQLSELARRLHGSADLFEYRNRKPYASINYVASHDGFTLRDLVSYNERNNHANREGNNDGHRGNYSFNHGIEGDTDDVDINRLRLSQQRNLLATLMVSQGVPMLQAGDELGRSQGGNNNTYCQDNDTSWIDWDGLDDEAHGLISFTRRLLRLRREFPVLRADRFRHQAEDSDDDSIRWLNSDGKPMRERQWRECESRVLGYLLAGNGDAARQQLLLVVFNASPTTQTFTMPDCANDEWCLILDTAEPDAGDERIAIGATSLLNEKSLQIFTSAVANVEQDTPTNEG